MIKIYNAINVDKDKKVILIGNYISESNNIIKEANLFAQEHNMIYIMINTDRNKDYLLVDEIITDEFSKFRKVNSIVLYKKRSNKDKKCIY